MSKHLIVNADDYGRAPGISAGVREAHRRGIVTTTTVMMTYPDAIAEIKLSRQICPDLGLGVHLCITAGRPVSPPQVIPSLVKADGTFYSIHDELYAVMPQVNLVELRAELRAQIERFLSTGAPLSHLDSHHHATYIYPPFFEVMLDLAREYRVPVRFPLPDDPGSIAASIGIPLTQAERLAAEGKALLQVSGVSHPDRFEVGFYGETASVETLLAILDSLPEGITELMCHPGYVGDALDGGYRAAREREVIALTHPAVRTRVNELGIELVTFESVVGGSEQ